MKIVNNRAIILKTKRPHMVTEKVKNYRILEEQGGVYKLAIRWDLEGAQALTDLKVKNVPSPISRDYVWGGRYTPFDHQKETSSF